MSAFGAAPRSSTVTITVADRYVVGHHITVTISGFAASPADELNVYNTPHHKCLSSVEAETRFYDDGVLSVLVNGHFSHAVKAIALHPSDGRTYVCAYVDGYPGEASTPTTYAHAGRYWLVVP